MILDKIAKIEVFMLVAVIVVSAFGEEDVVWRTVDAPEVRQGFGMWPSTPPADCPFPQSETFVGVSFTSRHAEYTNADTWYPSWASDGNLYSPWTDGKVNDTSCFSGGRKAATGHATILGDDPLHLKIVDEGVFRSDPYPYAGRYPCGSLIHDGVWYYGTYCLHPSGLVKKDGRKYNWPWLGPFVGFRWSTDFGKTWHETPCTPERPLFGEQALNGEPVKMGVPCFVDFGRNMEHSPDGKAYLVVQGSSDGKGRRYGYNSWITADQVFLIRVTPSVENMNDASKYEFYAGHGTDGKPMWTHLFSKIAPLLEWRDHMGRISATYNPELRKYLMCVTDGGSTVSKFNTYVLESDSLTGPWRLVSYMKDFGEQAYFVNIPSKFIDRANGRTMWLCYAANFSAGHICPYYRSIPSGSRYAMCLQEFRFVKRGEAMQPVAPAPNPLDSPQNVARSARVRASSTYPGYRANGAVDGVVDGYPGDISMEWASNGEGDTAFIRLDWDTPQTIRRVLLFDRPNSLDRIESGILTFSDGTAMRTGELPDDAKTGLEVEFPPKTVRWVEFSVLSVKKGSPNIGLSEMAVFTDTAAYRSHDPETPHAPRFSFGNTEKEKPTK